MYQLFHVCPFHPYFEVFLQSTCLSSNQLPPFIYLYTLRPGFWTNKEFAHEAASLKADLVKLLQIKGLTDVRVVNRYDVENIDKELFD